MSNELIKQSQLPLPEIMSIGKAFAESGMFPDVKSAAQAVVKIQAGQEMGISPFAAMNGINIIMGKPTVGAGIIASKVKSSGKYNYKVKEHTEKICSIDYYEGSEMIGNSTFTIEDAKKANTKNMDKYPKNMLFARAMSNGQKWYCPDVFSGPVYTPEEMENGEQKTEDVPHEEIFVIPDAWKKKAESCKTKRDIDFLIEKNIVTITANPELKKFLEDRKNELPEAPETTLHNHKEIKKDGKPLITNEQFKKACQRINSGETDVYQKTIDAFSLEEKQFNLLTELYNTAINALKTTQ